MAQATAETLPVEAEVEQALALHKAGRLAEAALLYERALAQAPQDVRVLRNLGALRRAEGRLDAALLLYERAATIAPEDPVLARNHGNALLAKGDWAGAAARFRTARAHEPGDAGLAVNLATALVGQGQPGEAETLCRELLERLPPLPPATRREAERLLAVAFVQTGRLAEAEAILERLRAADEGEPIVLDTLGDLRLQQSRPEEAVTLWQQARARRPESPAFDRKIGRTLCQLGRVAEAEPYLRRALGRQPEEPGVILELAFALMRLERFAEAEPLGRRLLERDPDNVMAQRLLAAVLRNTGRGAEAVAALRRVIELDPADEVSRYFLRSLLGESEPTAPASYVRSLFDDYAPYFETHLVGRLGYRAPEQLIELLEEAAPGRRFAHALDLGCGTGLMGTLLRPRADRLTGVDLAPKMVEAARAKGVYDALEAAEITAFLDAHEEPLDLVTAADVLVYIGDLAPLFRAVARRLAPGGLVLLTTELGEPDETWRLLASGRFRHGGAYLKELAATHGLELRAERMVSLRHEHGRPLPGACYALGRRAGALDEPAPPPLAAEARPGAFSLEICGPAGLQGGDIVPARPRRDEAAPAIRVAAAASPPAPPEAAAGPALRPGRAGEPRVLLAHDCGEGLGHVGRLVPIARALQAAGCQCLIGVRNLAVVGAMLAERGLRCVQAPFADGLERPLVQGRRVTSWADILTTYAFDVEERLEGLARGWDTLLDLVEPDLVVADFAPFLSLAARGRAPVVQLGSGWTLPPVVGGGFPPLPEAGEGPWLPEAALLESANAVQRRRGRPELSALGDLLAAEGSFVTVLPLLDPYAALRPEPAAGPLEPLPAPATTAPEAGWFAYLAADYAGTPKVIEALAEVAGEGSLFVRGASPEQRAGWQAMGLAVHDRPVPLAEAVTSARLLVHHGGLASTQLALALGRPQLFVPRHMEHIHNAQTVGRRGAGARLLAGGAFEPGHVRKAMQALLGQERFREAAAALAHETAAAGHVGALEPIVRACRDALARSRRLVAA